MNKPEDDFYTVMFCTLLHNKDWHTWLNFYDNDIYDEVLKSQRMNCANGKIFVNKILNKIYDKGGKDDFMAFAIRAMPAMIRKMTKNIDNPVFPFYNPHVLSFPRRLIIKGNNLKNKVEDFIRDKCGVDYLIIGDSAYVEYFDYQHKDMISKIDPTDRQIQKFRELHGL